MKRANITTIDNRVKYRRLILMMRPELKSMNCGIKREDEYNPYPNAGNRFDSQEESWASRLSGLTSLLS